MTNREYIQQCRQRLVEQFAREFHERFGQAPDQSDYVLANWYFQSDRTWSGFSALSICIQQADAMLNTWEGITPGCLERMSREKIDSYFPALSR